VKEKIYLTVLLWTNHGCITTNPNQSVFQCNGNIQVSLQPKILTLRYHLGRLRLSCIRILRNMVKMWILHHTVKFKLQDVIHRKLQGQLARGVLLHHNNARPHTAWANQERIHELQWELFEHPLYRLDLAPSDFHLFGPLKYDHSANIKRWRRD
jgi:hypothetical protein